MKIASLILVGLFSPLVVHADDPVVIWDLARPIPAARDLPVIDNVKFHVIKKYEFEQDGYRFLHGVGLVWHRGVLYASFGHNQGGENTAGEQARFCTSDDGGITWTRPQTIEASEDPDLGVSHGVFLKSHGRLWSFHGAYRGTLKDVPMRGYLLDEETGLWQPQGTLVTGGFWPLGEPIRMEDGNWIIAGLSVGNGNPPAVVISEGDDLTQWHLQVIPLAENLGKVWGESAVIVDGANLINLARWGAQPHTLVSFSEDFGRTWTKAKLSNLKMAPSKPAAGVLSTGQRFLICTTTADGGNRRSPLTIALSEPGESAFSRILVIRHAVFPEGEGESHPKAALAYPCVIEHEGHLYVGYSNSGGGVGRVGTGRELWNNNSAELAIIPLSELQ